MSPRILLIWAVPLGILGVAAYGCWQGTEQDVVYAVRGRNVDRVKRLLERDPSAVHTKVYPQAHERLEERRNYRARTGLDPWQGKYLIHEAAGDIMDPLPMLNVLADAGADLSVRLNGRTLLHIAAEAGNLEVAKWLIDRGADVRAVNDCSDPCEQRGQTALHDGLAFKDDAMSMLLLDRGAPVAATDARGRTALHTAAAMNRLGGAFVLCRYGADPAATDKAGQTPYDLAAERSPGSDSTPPSTAAQSQLAQWLRPAGGCATVAATARANGAPVSEDDARRVFADTVVLSTQ